MATVTVKICFSRRQLKLKKKSLDSEICQIDVHLNTNYYVVYYLIFFKQTKNITLYFCNGIYLLTQPCKFNEVV